MAQESPPKPRAARVLSLVREGENDTEFAKRLGVAPQHIGNWRKGRNDTSLEVLLDISKRTGADFFWLATGEPGNGTLGQLVTPQEAGELRAMLDQARDILNGALARAGVIIEPAAGASRPLSDEEIASEGQLPDEQAG